ncbi:MAG: cell division protein FtsQ/DivIB [Christensenellales bacterium]
MKRKKTAIILLVLVVLIGAAAFVGYTFFKVEAITVVGNQRYSAEEIINLAGLQYEQNIFMVNEGDVAGNINTSPVLVYEKLERRYPNEMILYVHERQERAYVQYLDSILVVDEEAYITETGTQAKEGIPSVTGVNVVSFQLGSELQAADPYQIKTLKALMEALLDNPLDVVDINIMDPSNLLLVLQDGTNVKLGNIDAVSDKLRRVSDIYEVLRQQGKTGGVLDVTGERGGSYMPDVPEPVVSPSPMMDPEQGEEDR